MTNNHFKTSFFSNESQLIVSTKSGAAPARIYAPDSPRDFSDNVRPLVHLKKPEPLGRNLLQVFRNTLHKAYRQQLLTAMRSDQWLCLNIEDFGWNYAIYWLKQSVALADRYDIDTFNQVVLADVSKLQSRLLLRAQTEFSLAGGHFYPYKGKSFEQSAKELDEDIQEEIDDYKKMK